MDDFKCPLEKVESLETWFSKEFGPGGECRPCRVAPLASLYLGVLEQHGEAEQAKSLTVAFDTGDIMTIAKTMDTIKVGAKDTVRKELEDLDCLAQTYQGEMGEEGSGEKV